MKRLMREAYRLNKFILADVLEGKKKQVALMFVFTGKELPDYKLVEEKMLLLLNFLSKKFSE